MGLKFRNFIYQISVDEYIIKYEVNGLFKSMFQSFGWDTKIECSMDMVQYYYKQQTLFGEGFKLYLSDTILGNKTGSSTSVIFNTGQFLIFPNHVSALEYELKNTINKSLTYQSIYNPLQLVETGFDIYNNNTIRRA